MLHFFESADAARNAYRNGDPCEAFRRGTHATVDILSAGSLAAGPARAVVARAGGRGAAVAAEVSASSVVGSRRMPLRSEVRQAPAQIGARPYSGHALTRMQQRGLVPTVVEDAIRHGSPSPSLGGSTVYYQASNNLSVVVNAQGRVITTSFGDLRKGR